MQYFQVVVNWVQLTISPTSASADGNKQGGSTVTAKSVGIKFMQWVKKKRKRTFVNWSTDTNWKKKLNNSLHVLYLTNSKTKCIIDSGWAELYLRWPLGSSGGHWKLICMTYFRPTDSLPFTYSGHLSFCLIWSSSINNISTHA